jgi:hypothetical protein
MSKIAYNIAGAAKAASVTEFVIVEAVKQRELVSRRIDGVRREGKRVVILRSDIQAWLKSKADYMATLHE